MVAAWHSTGRASAASARQGPRISTETLPGRVDGSAAVHWTPQITSSRLTITNLFSFPSIPRIQKIRLAKHCRKVARFAQVQFSVLAVESRISAVEGHMSTVQTTSASRSLAHEFEFYFRPHQADPLR